MHRTNRARFALAAMLGLAVTGCTRGSSDGSSQVTDGGESPSRAEVAKPPSPRTAPIADPPGDVVTDPLALDLPQAEVALQPGQAIWAAVPRSGSQTWTYAKGRLAEARGAKRIAVTASGTHELPSAFAHAAAPAEDLRPGLPVVVHAEGEARWGRVQSISGTEVRVKYAVGHGATGDGSFGLDDLEVLGRHDLVPGAPVLFSRGTTVFIGMLALVTGERAYVICGRLLELPRTAVTPIDTSKLAHPGDPVVYVPPDAHSCETIDGTATALKASGVLYEVQTTGRDAVEVPFGLLSPHPSLARPRAP